MDIFYAVIPREFGERYQSEFNDQDLVTGNGFRENEYPVPETLPSRQVLERYIPQRDFFTSPERAASFYHGADHLMRVLVLQETLTNLLIESGAIQPEQIDREALRWSAMAHDIRRHSDFIGRGHAQAAVNWVLQLLPSDMSQETKDKIFAIVKGHDGDIPPASFVSTELAILKDADALDRVRLERKLPAAITPGKVRRFIGLDPTRLRFETSRELVPFANELYRLSTYDENKRVANPENAVFEAATQVGVLAA